MLFYTHSFTITVALTKIAVVGNISGKNVEILESSGRQPQHNTHNNNTHNNSHTKSCSNSSSTKAGTGNIGSVAAPLSDNDSVVSELTASTSFENSNNVVIEVLGV